MTGRLPDATGVYNLTKHFRETLPNVVTLPQLFQRNGYFAARVGKIYHYGNPGQIGTPGLDDPPSWDVAINPRGVDKDEEKVLTNHTPKRGLGSSLSLYASPAPDEQHTDGKVASETIKLLEQRAQDGKPFFLAAGFYRPHCPYIAPKKYFDLYPLDKIAAPKFSMSEWANLPPAALFIKEPHFGVNEQQQREAIQAYYASISFLDANVGRLLDALDRLKLTDNTVIVFWSDHGYLLGEHGQWMKQTLFEGAARAPLLMAGPEVVRGKASGRTVEFVDIYPTLADLCALNGTPQDLAGRSLRPLLKNPRATWTRPALTQVQRGGPEKSFMGYSVRDERWRYTEWDEGRQGAELYDETNDPRELRNLASDPKYKAELARMKRLLQQAKQR
jgi:iduronate 2-sulfatase